MISTIIFDLNGVFIQSPKLSDRFAKDFNVPVENFLPVLKEIMNKVRQPNAGDSFLHWKPYLEKWGIEFDREKFFEYWFEAEKEVPEMIKIAKNLKNKNIKLLILSNNFEERANYYKTNFPFIKEIFDEVYYSWQTGFVKPSPMAYQNILTKQNLNPEDCLYFDDSEDNIEAARKMRIQAFKFNDAADIKNIISKLCLN
jgi:putative hydrolase of the HAD superfamily